MNVLEKVIFIIILLFHFQFTQAQTWQYVTMHFPTDDTLLERTTIIFATKNTGWFFTSGEYFDSLTKSYKYSTKILKTIDGGYNWILQKNVGNILTHYWPFVLDSLHCWAIDRTTGNFIFTSNGGSTWDTTHITTEEGKYFYAPFFFDYQNGIVYNNYRWVTNDGGYHWYRDNDPLSRFPPPSDIYFANKQLGWIVSLRSPIGFDSGSIAYSSDGGKTWNYQDSTAALLYSADFIDSLRGFAVGTNVSWRDGIIYLTKNGGETWNWNVIQGKGPIWDVGFLDEFNGWITGTAGQIWKTTNSGDDWSLQNLNTDATLRNIMILKSEKAAYIFGGKGNGSSPKPPFVLFYADLTNITDVEQTETDIPLTFSLMQNYPNPFNSSTIISLSIQREGNITIRVYDILGREMVTLFEGRVQTGLFKTEWDGKDYKKRSVGSGIYFYRVEIDNNISIGKMILLR